MPSNKNQHYVPQFLLRYFSPNGRSIGVFLNKSKKIIQHVSIKDQCSKDYLYGNDENEKMLSSLEGEFKLLIEKIITIETPPSRFSPEHSFLLQFLTLQRARTLGAASIIDDMTKKFGEIIIPIIGRGIITEEEAKEFELVPEDPVLQSMMTLLPMWPLLWDLDFRLIKNETTEGFVLSDDPVVFYNKYLEKGGPGKYGMLSVGLQIYISLTPRYSLLFFDSNIYSCDSSASKINIANNIDIVNLNSLSVINSQNTCYFDHRYSSEKYLKKLIGPLLRARPTSRVDVNRYDEFAPLDTCVGEAFNKAELKTKVEKNPQKGTFIVHNRVVQNIDLHLSFIKIKKSAVRTLPEFLAKVGVRNEYMHRMLLNFRKRVEAGDYPHSAFFDYLISQNNAGQVNAQFPFR